MRLRCAVALCLLLSSSAFADAEADAAERYDRGVKLFDAAKGDVKMYAAALAEFEAAYAAMPAFQVLFNIAITQKKLGRFGAALQTFERYLEQGGAEVPAGRREVVQQQVAEIRTMVGEVQVVVSGPPADVWVNGEPVGRSPLPRPLMLVSGTYTLRATRAGHLPDEKPVTVLSGNQYKVELSPTPRDIGVLAVTSAPTGASLTLDGRPLGTSPWRGDVPVGGHRLLVQLEGYEPQTQDLVVAAGQTREVNVELVVPPTPWFKRWYVWAGAAVLVGGAAAYGGWEATRVRPDRVVRLP